MTIEAAREKFSLFFYLLFGDERRVYAASIEAFHYLNATRTEISDIDFVRNSFRILKKHKDKAKTSAFTEIDFIDSNSNQNVDSNSNQKINPNPNPNLNSNINQLQKDKSWASKKNISLQKWEQVRSVTTVEDLAYLIYGHVFNISIQNLSQALEVSTGTIRYRLRNTLLNISQWTVGKPNGGGTVAKNGKSSFNLIKGGG